MPLGQKVLRYLPREEQERISRGTLGLTGGTAAEGFGTCGAIIGACFVVSYVSGIGWKELGEDVKNSSIPLRNCKIYVTDKCTKQFGSIRCLEIRYRRTGFAYSFTDRVAFSEALKFAFKTHPERCGMGTINTPMSMAAGWGAEGVCDVMKIE